MISRRSFLTGLIAAPAIVHAGNLMPVKWNIWCEPLQMVGPDYAELAAVTRTAFLPNAFVQLWKSTPYMQTILNDRCL